MAEQTESGYIGHCLHAWHGAELAADLVERDHLIDSALHIGILGNTALLSSGHETNAKRFGEKQFAARLSGVVALELVHRDLAGDGQAKDGFRRVDAVTSG